jgi:hypothetical protein
VRTPFGSACITASENGEIRAVHTTEVATTAFLGIYDVGRVVTRRIESGRKSQNVGGTELHAKAAALAAIHGNGDETFGQRTLQMRLTSGTCTARATEERRAICYD